MSEVLYEGVLFSGMPREDCDRIIETCTAKTFDEGEAVFAEGDEGSSLWIVEGGSVEAFKVFSGDVDRPIGAFREGDIFGEISFLDGSHRSAGARAIEESTLLNLKRDDFDRLAEDHTAVAKAFYERLACIIADRLRITNQSYKESVEALLDAIGASSLNLPRLAETFKLVTIYLVDQTTVTGKMLGFDNQPSGWVIMIRNQSGTISLIPYHSVVKIEVE